MRTRKRKKSKVKMLKPHFNKKELQKMAARVWKYRPLDICNLARTSYQERAAMFSGTSTMLQAPTLKEHEREMLLYFLSALKITNKAVAAERQRKEAEVRLKRETRLKAIRDHKKEMAELVQLHPLGHVIGQTQVCEFKSPRSNIQWATKRKRKQ